MNISTKDTTVIKTYLNRISTPSASSHKGQNGKVLVIGGSSLFHGAVLWSAESASQIVDMVHVASTEENNEIIQKIKTIWQTGMVIKQAHIPQYAKEDDVILIGNGMMRNEKDISLQSSVDSKTWEDVLSIADEGEFTRELVHYLLYHFPDKQFVLDAGALQMMDVQWLIPLHKRAIITPHQKEFETLFNMEISELSMEEKEEVILKKAEEYNCIILLKAVEDIISDGNKLVKVSGGNAGLTKGGTGDVLAGLTSGMSATSDPFSAAVVASYLLKKTAEELFGIKGFWYTAKDVISLFPTVYHTLTTRV